MIFLHSLDPGLLGIIFLLIASLLMFIFAAINCQRKNWAFREIAAFKSLNQALNSLVESGKKLHITLGSGGIFWLQGASGLLSLSILHRFIHITCKSDRPPLVTSGDGLLAILSQDVIQKTYQEENLSSEYDPSSGQITGLTPNSYTAGTIPVILDQQVFVNLLVGHFTCEVGLLRDASERIGSLTIAGSEDITVQAVLYPSTRELLIGEELFAGGAYIQPTPTHVASLQVQDVLRWGIVGVILLGILLKIAGIL